MTTQTITLPDNHPVLVWCNHGTVNIEIGANPCVEFIRNIADKSGDNNMPSETGLNKLRQPITVALDDIHEVVLAAPVAPNFKVESKVRFACQTPGDLSVFTWEGLDYCVLVENEVKT